VVKVGGGRALQCFSQCIYFHHHKSDDPHRVVEESGDTMIKAPNDMTIRDNDLFSYRINYDSSKKAT
jgi:hypothetical protein